MFFSVSSISSRNGLKHAVIDHQCAALPLRLLGGDDWAVERVVE
ncbi:Uncharacterised protein [Escherichia coli]|uniref:Uncharacterized protein n=1 Tax=Escherichia coli TaxID=562 RepID=A0A376LIB3_ECOLX|nr:Uncharacterised protein [Escherichia coli]